MGKEQATPYLTWRDQSAVIRLWNELAEFPASSSQEALRHCLGSLAEMVGATNVFWLGSTRQAGWEKSAPNDPLFGWRPRATVYLHTSETRQRGYAIAMEMVRKNQPDPQTIAATRGFGRSRSHLREELVATHDWEHSWLYHEVLRPSCIDDRMVSAYAAAPTAESYLVLDRESHSTSFRRRERDIVAFFLSSGRVFHRELLQSYGLLNATQPLSARERDVLRLLLTGETEREIAYALGLTPGTVHQYVVTVLRKFGARSRTDLMAQWLRRLTPNDPKLPR